MAFEPLTYSKSWENPEDFPAYEPDEQQVRADLQLLHNEARDAINRLVAALTDQTAAALLPVAPIGTLTAQTVQQAIEQVYAEAQNAAAAMMVDGSVTKQKLSQKLMERVYGGRLWVSMDAPTQQENPDSDFPVGQLWMRPAVTVSNLAQEAWEVIGGSGLQEGDGWCFTTDGTRDCLTASQLLEAVGTAGQRVAVRLSLGECSTALEELSLYINGVEQELAEDGCCVEAALDQTGSLELLLRGQWPMELEQEEIRVQHLSVVNVDALMPAGCAESKDWAAFVEHLGAFAQTELPMVVWLQTRYGVWEAIFTPAQSVYWGGTGLSEVPAGALLCGTGTQNLEALAPAQGVLQCSEGKPRWIEEGELAQKNGYLRTMAGSYAGVGGNGDTVIELPLQPLIVHIWAEDDTVSTATIANGGRSNEEYFVTFNGNEHSYQGYVALNGSTLTISHETGVNEVNRVSEHMNKAGVTYKWLAIY